MPFTVSEILATQDRTVRIVQAEGGGFRIAEEGEEALVTVVYRIGAMTPRSEMEMQARFASAKPEDTSWLIPLMLPLVASWDIETDDHEPWPITEEGLSDLHYAILWGVFECINRDAEIPKASTSTSSAGSARPKTVRKASGAKSRRGSTRSPASRELRAS